MELDTAPLWSYKYVDEDEAHIWTGDFEVGAEKYQYVITNIRTMKRCKLFNCSSGKQIWDAWPYDTLEQAIQACLLHHRREFKNAS